MKSFLETCLLNLFADESLKKKSYKICLYLIIWLFDFNHMNKYLFYGKMSTL